MFTEKNSIEDLIKDVCVKMGWKFVIASDLPRHTHDVLIEPHLSRALKKLNADIMNESDQTMV